jgi:NitT/TauT family transport system substrate-binding protein
MPQRLLVKFLPVLFLGLICACQSPMIPAESNEPSVQQPQSTTETQELVMVTINSSNQINYAPIFFAQEEGYFEEYGITLEIMPFNRVTEAVPLLVSGQLDVYAGSISVGFINILGKEPYIKAVADRGRMVQDSCTFQAIVVRKDLYDSGNFNGPADLEGRSVASNTSGARGFHLSNYLAQAGLTFDNVDLVDIPSSSYIDALDNKIIDFIVQPEIVLTRLLKNGNVVVLSRAEDVIGPYQSSILAFGPRLIRDDPELGVRFLAAYLKGVKKYNEGKTPENIQLLVEKTGEDIEVIQEACWVPIREDGIIRFEEVDPFQQWSASMGQLDVTITEEQFWDPSFLEAASELLGISE